jgi:DNA-binding Xre family transcriptional regulator
MNRKYLGSNFDDFLKEEGLLAEAEAVAVKRVVAFQIAQLMESDSISKTALAERMQTSRSAIERLLDPANESVTLQTLERAALALGKRLQIELVDFTLTFNGNSKKEKQSGGKQKRWRNRAKSKIQR